MLRMLPDLEDMNLDRVKHEVKVMWRMCRAAGEEITISDLYEEISECYGFCDWNCFSAWLKRKEFEQ